MTTRNYYLKLYLEQTICGPITDLSNDSPLQDADISAERSPTYAYAYHARDYFRQLPLDHSMPALIGLTDSLYCGIAPHADGCQILGPFKKPQNLWLRYDACQTDAAEAVHPADIQPTEITPALLAQAVLLVYYDAAQCTQPHSGTSSTQDDAAYLTVDDLLLKFAAKTEHAAHAWQQYNNLLFRNMENNVIHNPYNQEIREYTAVENGDVEELERIQKEDYTDRNGTLAMDPVRNEINMGIVVTTLTRAAAARGGLSPEICYSLSDATIQEMEQCKDLLTIRNIYRTSELHYTRLVREEKNRLAGRPDGDENDNLHIQHCKDYIFTHLHSKITVSQIADVIGLEPNYLSALFHRCEHVTLKQYILNEKIKLVKNMLAYSPYSYIEIANYLGFSSQSHLGEQFKRVTGTTMKKYRERHGKEDFLQDVVDSEGQAEA